MRKCHKKRNYGMNKKYYMVGFAFMMSFILGVDCFHCNKLIEVEEEYFVISGNNFHKSCFSCSHCNNPIEDSEYQSDPTWFFEYLSSYNINQNHLYQIDIPMRPLNGSELLDEDGKIVKDEN